MCQPTTQGKKMLAPISPFQDYPIIPASVAQISNNFPKTIQSISNKLQNFFKPNHESLWKKINPSYVKMSPIKSQNFETFKEKFFFSKAIKICGCAPKFLKGQKLKGWIHKAKVSLPFTHFFGQSVFFFSS